MKISKVIFHIKPIPSHPWWECKNRYYEKTQFVYLKSNCLWTNWCFFNFCASETNFSNWNTILNFSRFRWFKNNLVFPFTFKLSKFEERDNYRRQFIRLIHALKELKHKSEDYLIWNFDCWSRHQLLSLTSIFYKRRLMLQSRDFTHSQSLKSSGRTWPDIPVVCGAKYIPYVAWTRVHVTYTWGGYVDMDI